MAALSIGLSAINRIDIVNRAGDGLQSLGEELDADVFLSVWSDYGPTVIRYDRSQRPSLSMIGLGFAFPLLTSATGLVFATFVAPDSLRSAMESAFEDNPELQDRDAGDVGAVHQHVEEKGYAYMSGTYLPRCACVAAPIFSIDGRIAAVVTYIVKSAGGGPPDQKRVSLLLDFCRRYSLSKSGYDEAPRNQNSVAV